MERLKSISPLLIVTVILPAIIALLYYGVLAQDIYISEARIVVRNPDKTPRSVLGVALDQTGLGGANEGNDAVIAYLQSRQAISDGNGDGLIKEAYSRDDVFWFDRFGWTGNDSDEHFYRYFQDQMVIEEGATTQVLTISVSAFDPDQAREINQRLVKQAEDLVNSLSIRAQTDLIAVAQAEVEQAAEDARAASVQLAQYRNKTGVVAPTQQSEATLQMISKLQDELIAAQTKLRQLQTYTPQASQIPFLQTQVHELRKEIATTRRELAGGRKSLSSALTKFQELELNAKFAESQLQATRASLLEAKAEARRKQAYLEQISAPSLPDYPMEPRRIRSIIATILLGLLAWGVLTMLEIGVREHRD